MRAQYDIRKRCTHPHKSKCPCSYYVFYGRAHRFSVDVQAGRHIETLAEATTLGDRWRKEIDDGVFVLRGRAQEAPAGSTAARDTLTLAEFVAVYLRDCSMLNRAGRPLKDRQHPDYYVFQPLLAFALPDGRVLGRLPFAAVDEKMYELFVADRRDQGYAASTVNKDVQLITAMCRWAARRKYFGYGMNPISGESRILVRKPPAQRQRRVTDAELLAIQAYADSTLWAFIELALITCLRLTELYRLKWSDHKGAYLQVRRDATKVESAARWAPLDDRGIAILGYLRVDPSDRKYPDAAFIFGQCGEPPTDINDRFNTVLLKALSGSAIEWANGVHGPQARARLDAIDLVFGDLRHEGALRKYEAGWKLNELQLLLGHTNLVQTSTYLGLGKDEVLAAMQRAGAGAKVIAGSAPTTPDYHKLPLRGRKPVIRKGGKQDVTH